MIAVGLIGYGLAGRAFHAPLIGTVGRLRLAAIVTSRRDAVAAAWPDARVVADPSALLDDPSIDLVVIATPNATHAPLAQAALTAGKHVVIDKPFATNPSDGEALIELARSGGRVLSVFHNRRWDGDFQTVARLLAEDRVGVPMLYEARWDRFRLAPRSGWKAAGGEGAGLLADLGPHLIDQALRLFGSPDALTADVAAQRQGAGGDDYFELTLHYGAMRAILSASTLIAAPRPRFAVHGDHGSFVKYGVDPQEAAMDAGIQPGSPGFGEEPPTVFGTLTGPDGAARTVPTLRGDYRRFYEGMADAILNGAPPPVDPADALAGLRLIELARRSSDEGRRIALR